MTALGAVEIGTPERAIDRDEIRSFFREAVLAARQRPVAIAIPAPAGAPLALLERLRRGDAFHLHDDRRSITALGATCVAALAGPSRFEEARRVYESTASQLVRVSHERCSDVQPIWTLGFSFAAGRARDAWSPLGDGLVTLPRWTHRAENGAATLTLVVGRDEPSGGHLALAELDALWDGLGERPLPTSQDRASVRHVDEARWAQSLADVSARIESGALAKVVVARRSSIVAEHDLDPIAVARRLERPGATVFCVRRRGVAFVGATPERLFRKRGRQLFTEAIAGTASLERDPAGLRLLASVKDLHEHRLVVDGIASALSAIRADVATGVRALRTIGAIAHLATPIEALLPSGLSAFDVLDALHPTAAVAGTPREGALRWIADNEPDRGWYAGPIGWIDASGNAEVYVALRSALIIGARAYAYAGCGVVNGSDPHAEYAETTLKLAPMLAALGVRE